MHSQRPGVLLQNSVTPVCSRRTNYPLEKKIGDAREILTFSGWNETDVLRHFIRDFCL